MSLGHFNSKFLAVAALPTVAALAYLTGFRPNPEPTFHEDVLEIIQEKCQDCHRPGGRNLGGMVAPMAFTTYEDTKPWAAAIKVAVESGRMPPWHASKEEHGKYRNERVLTDEQIATFVTWADNGAPEGDPSKSPPPVSFPSATGGWSIGEPDLVVAFPEPFLVHDSVQDLYVDILVELTEDQLPEDRWIKSVEFLPGSPVVHHIIASPIGGLAPGYEPRQYDTGFSRPLRKGSNVNFQMHYHKTPGPGTAVYDTTMAAIRFYQPGDVITHVVETESLGMFQFVIPPNDSNFTASTSWTFQKDVNILSMNPHMHLRGKAAKYTVTFPDGRQELLASIPKYDFNWQHSYQLREPVFAPKGTRVDLQLWWDNSANNPSNPNPNREVRWGRPTTDEMGFGFMVVVEVEPRHIVVGEEVPSDLPRPRPMIRRGGRN
jgi:hypothetical protein